MTAESKSDAQHSFGVFKPVGHVVVSFPSAQQMDEAARALSGLSLPTDAVRRFSDREMLAQIDADLQRASALAGIGQELNLVKAHRALAERGYHWLVIRAETDLLGRKIAALMRSLGAERAQLYGRFIIEELIPRRSDQAQVSESPDRGLDAQTPSGKEDERAVIRPRPPTQVVS
ncbi:MAG: hypothetical protein HY021_02525 [Burkholderiales bacterium]|nr:hypothetical protein [Burkholderiales bacterium]